MCRNVAVVIAYKHPGSLVGAALLQSQARWPASVPGYSNREHEQMSHAGSAGEIWEKKPPGWGGADLSRIGALRSERAWRGAAHVQVMHAGVRIS